METVNVVVNVVVWYSGIIFLSLIAVFLIFVLKEAITTFAVAIDITWWSYLIEKKHGIKRGSVKRIFFFAGVLATSFIEQFPYKKGRLSYSSIYGNWKGYRDWKVKSIKGMIYGCKNT